MTTSQPPERMEADSESAILDRPLSSYVTFDWETVAWIALFILAVVTRFYDLGVRAMSHDESLHTLYSYYLYDAGNYDHNPMMHGPLLFHVNALIYALFGVTDATARVGPALAGLGVVYMTRLFRRYIGRSGALLAGLMIVISPTLLFHSRYIRNDIYIALFTLIWIFGFSVISVIIAALSQCLSVKKVLCSDFSVRSKQSISSRLRKLNAPMRDVLY